MPQRRLGDRPMTAAERVAKHQKKRRELLNRLLDAIEARAPIATIRALAAALRPPKKPKE